MKFSSAPSTFGGEPSAAILDSVGRPIIQSDRFNDWAGYLQQQGWSHLFPFKKFNVNSTVLVLRLLLVIQLAADGRKKTGSERIDRFTHRYDGYSAQPTNRLGHSWQLSYQPVPNLFIHFAPLSALATNRLLRQEKGVRIEPNRRRKPSCCGY